MMNLPDSPDRKPNILAVDDYPANLIALSAVLSADYNLIEATSGKQALEILESRSDIDVILMDLQMPDMDGFETARRVKKLKNCEEIPIIFITAVYKEEPYVKKGYEVGGIDYFSKPFDPDLLKLKVKVYASFRQRGEFLKERERQLRETEDLIQAGRKLSGIFETLPVGVLIADVEGRICQINDQVSQICDAALSTKSEAYGEVLSWWDEAGKMMKEPAGPLFKAIHKGQSSHNQTILIKCADGTTKKIIGSASPLLALDGHIVGAVVVIQDVTESKKIEEDLESKINRLVSKGYNQETIQNR